jgi:hypothetical protein
MSGRQACRALVRAVNAVERFRLKLIKNPLGVTLRPVERYRVGHNNIASAADVDHAPGEIATLKIIAANPIGFGRLIHFPCSCLAATCDSEGNDEYSVFLLAPATEERKGAG